MSTTYFPTTYRPPRLNLWPILVLAVGITVALCAHALMHRSAPDIAYICNKNGPSITLRNPITGFRVHICQMHPDRDNWGRIIMDERNQNLTAYGGEGGRMDTLRRTIENLYRGGFRQVEYMRSDLASRIAEILSQMP